MMKIDKNLGTLLTIITIAILSIPGVTGTVAFQPTIMDDYDPLVDVSVTVHINKIRAFDKFDRQLLRWEYVDQDSDPDYFVKVIINGEESTSQIWENTRYIYDINWSANLNVPDDVEFVDVSIQLWDADEQGNPDKLCDISPDTGSTDDSSDVELTYSIKTGRWQGDDYVTKTMNDADPSGYGRLNGCDDGSIYKRDCDAELWFDITQTDYDNDGIPYWMEVNEYSTDPMIDNRGEDADSDLVPIEWEWKWTYNPTQYESHITLDPDVDGLNNYEEFRTAQWESDPFRKDLFIELDQMEDSPTGETSTLPENSKEILYTAYNRQNIVYHLDDGKWEETGSEIIPFDELTECSWTGHDELDQIYETYFVHGDPNNWRLGVFHYGVVIYQSSLVNGNMFGRNRFQISSHGMEEKAKKLILDRDVVYASAYMHETGHTLSFWPIGGHNDRSKYPWQLGWWFWRPYKSCMNYGYMYTTVDYSDGSRGLRDFDDWTRLDLTYFDSL